MTDVRETGTAKGAVTVLELSREQAQAARRVAESRSIVPDVTLGAVADVEAALGEHGVSVTALVVRACALALRDHPRVNGAYRDARFELYDRVNVAVTTPDGDPPVSPTILDADTKALDALEAELTAQAERARSGQLTSRELSGATFTVACVTADGVARHTPVVTPPQAAALGVGAVAPRAVVAGDELRVRRCVELNLACDHRILPAPMAAAFLSRVRALLEDPAALGSV